MALTKVPSNLDATISVTQSASDNSTNIATTAYVTTAIANLVDGAPSTLNTLDEIAAALNDDAALNTTLTNSIATKLPLAGGTMTGALIVDAGNSGLDIRVGTDKRVLWQGNIGEIGNVAGFQATNTAGSANTDFGIRATSIRFATGSSEKVRVASAGHLQFNPVNSFSGLNNSILSSSNTYMYMMGGAAGLYLADNADLSNSIGIRDAGYMDFNTGGTGEKMRIASDGAVTLKPNGITTGLRLQGRSSDNNFYIQFKSNDGNTTYSSIGTDSANTALFYQSNTHKFQNTASNNTYMTIDSSGKVAIGPSSASYKLDVGHVGSGEIQARFKSSGDTGYTQGAIVLESSDSSDSPASRGQGVYMFNHGTDKTWYSGTLYSNPSSYGIGVVGGSTLQTSAADDGSSLAFVIDQNRNVGIGTASPSSLLELRKTTAGNITGGTGNKGAVLTLHHEAQWENGYTGGDWLGAIDFSTGDASTGEGVRASIRATSDNYYNTNSLAFYTADQGDTTLDQRMIIKSDGEVGIGRLPENAKVHILGNQSYVGNYGYATLCLEDDNGYAGLAFRDGNENWLIRRDGSTEALQIVNSSNASAPGTGSFTNRFEIEAGGDIKIGATGSGNAYKLEVYDGDYTTMMLRAPTYPTLKFKADNQNSGQNGSISIGANNAIYMNPNNSTTGIYVSNDGTFNSSTRHYHYGSMGEHHVRTGGRHGTGTYTLFTNGISNSQSAGTVEIWGIYGTPSGAGYRMYTISGDRSIVTSVAYTQTSSVPQPTLAWSGANLQVSNSNSSLYYHVRVTLHDIGYGWTPTWGNFPGIS